MRVRAALPIPLIGETPPKTPRKSIQKRSLVGQALRGNLSHSDIRNSYVKWDKDTLQRAHLKTERHLGAPWIDNFVATRRIVSLCELCYRRYDKWWVKHNYRPDWKAHRILSDCDGCSRRLINVVNFFPNA